MDLELLAKALNAGGIVAHIRSTGTHKEAVRYVETDYGDYLEGSEPANEYPALAFAMLDVLQKVAWGEGFGIGLTWVATWLPAPYQCDFDDGAYDPPLKGRGTTRTEAVALALIAAYEAGLLDGDKTR